MENILCTDIFLKTLLNWNSCSNSLLSLVFFSVLESGPPENVALVPVSSTQLLLTWETPSDKNGVISGYYITWTIVRNDTNHTVDGNLIRTKVNESTKSYDILNLGMYLQLF